VIDRHTMDLVPIAEPAEAADLRLWHVAGTEHDEEFYVLCADFITAAEVVIQRASLKGQRPTYRSITELTEAK
jgi:hypothetical protein